jgi:hypothetical protein
MNALIVDLRTQRAYNLYHQDETHRCGAGPPHAVGAPPSVPEFSIVPVRGLPIVAALLVGLVVAIASNSLWALTFFHVAGGGLWTSIDLFLGLIIGPILGRLPVQSRIDFTVRFMPKMILIMPTLVAMTLGAGFQLARHLGNLDAAYPHHGWLVASYIIVGAMAVIALGLLEPANLAVLFELKKPRPNGERVGRLMKIFIYTAGITGLMQIATIVIMTFLASR